MYFAGKTEPNQTFAGLQRTFYPKYVSYFGSGSGRDSHIIEHNGGLSHENKMGMRNNGVHLNAYKVRHGNSPSPPSKSPPTFYYQSDGTGRDSYVLADNGGLRPTYDKHHKSSEAIFRGSLRHHEKSPLKFQRNAFLDRADITSYLNWGSSQSRVANSKNARMQKDLVQRLSQKRKAFPSQRFKKVTETKEETSRDRGIQYVSNQRNKNNSELKNFKNNNIKHGRRNAQMLDLSKNNSPAGSLERPSGTFEVNSPLQVSKHTSKLSILHKANNLNNQSTDAGAPNNYKNTVYENPHFQTEMSPQAHDRNTIDDQHLNSVPQSLSSQRYLHSTKTSKLRLKSIQSKQGEVGRNSPLDSYKLLQMKNKQQQQYQKSDMSKSVSQVLVKDQRKSIDEGVVGIPLNMNDKGKSVMNLLNFSNDQINNSHLRIKKIPTRGLNSQFQDRSLPSLPQFTSQSQLEIEGNNYENLPILQKHQVSNQTVIKSHNTDQSLILPVTELNNQQVGRKVLVNAMKIKDLLPEQQQETGNSRYYNKSVGRRSQQKFEFLNKPASLKRDFRVGEFKFNTSVNTLANTKKNSFSQIM